MDNYKCWKKKKEKVMVLPKTIAPVFPFMIDGLSSIVGFYQSHRYENMESFDVDGVILYRFLSSKPQGGAKHCHEHRPLLLSPLTL